MNTLIYTDIHSTVYLHPSYVTYVYIYVTDISLIQNLFDISLIQIGAIYRYFDKHPYRKHMDFSRILEKKTFTPRIYRKNLILVIIKTESDREVFLLQKFDISHYREV